MAVKLRAGRCLAWYCVRYKYTSRMMHVETDPEWAASSRA